VPSSWMQTAVGLLRGAMADGEMSTALMKAFAACWYATRLELVRHVAATDGQSPCAAADTIS